MNHIILTKFWQNKSLEEMSADEWEALCDRCGLCCLHKTIDEDTGAIDCTSIACKFLNIDRCECGDYASRHKINPDCVDISSGNIEVLKWMPETCAYRLILENIPLPDWHYLISGDKETVHSTGNSARGKAVSEIYVHPDDV